MGSLESAETNGNRSDRTNTPLRLTPLFILFSIILFCSAAQGYYTITPDKTFIIENTTYCFNYTLNVSSIGKTGSWLVVDTLYMEALPSDNASLLVRINGFDADSVNFSYHADKPCSILFNCSGTVFSKYYIGGEETIVASFSSHVVPSNDMQNQTIDALLNVTDPFNIIFSLMPIIAIVIIAGVILAAVMSFGRM